MKVKSGGAQFFSFIKHLYMAAGRWFRLEIFVLPPVMPLVADGT